MIHRDLHIRKLMERNDKLNDEVRKIDRVLDNIDEKVTYGIKLPEIKADVQRK